MEQTKPNGAGRSIREATAFDELQHKFLEALENEEKQILEQAQQRAASVVSEAEQKAQQAANDTLKRAREESRRIVQDAERKAQETSEKMVKDAEAKAVAKLAAARDLAKQLLSESARFASEVSALKLNLECELEHGIMRDRQNTGTDGGGQGTDHVIAAAEGDAPLDRSAGEAKRSVPPVVIAEQNIIKPVGTTGDGATRATAGIHTKVKTIEQTPAPPKSLTIKAGVDKPFLGTLEFHVIGKGDCSALPGLLNYLTHSQEIEVLATGSSTATTTKVVVFLRKPTPILKILKQAASVEDAIEIDSNIQIRLSAGMAWVG